LVTITLEHLIIKMILSYLPALWCVIWELIKDNLKVSDQCMKAANTAKRILSMINRIDLLENLQRRASHMVQEFIGMPSRDT